MKRLARRIMMVVGTRPNFVKISQFEKAFKQYPGLFEYTLVHTGQHYDDNMSTSFFRQLGIRKPDFQLGVKQTEPTLQTAEILCRLQPVVRSWKPDLILSPGDVTSTLAAALTANKMGVPFAHLESGLRSFDKSMPEEHNRLMADTLAEYHFVSEASGAVNLSKENKASANMVFVGNTMIDTLVAFDDEILANPILEELGLEEKGYALLTMHRPGNVDNYEGLTFLNQLIDRLTRDMTVVFPVHPRTQKQLEKAGLWDLLQARERVVITPPKDYFGFQKLIASSKVVLTDSGGIQEETTFRKVPCLTLRNNTERPSTIRWGTNQLVGQDFKLLDKYLEEIEEGTFKTGSIPRMWDGKSTERIVKWLYSPNRYLEFYPEEVALPRQPEKTHLKIAKSKTRQLQHVMRVS